MASDHRLSRNGETYVTSQIVSAERRDAILSALRPIGRSVQNDYRAARSKERRLAALSLFFAIITTSGLWFLMMRELPASVEWLGALSGLISVFFGYLTLQTKFNGAAVQWYEALVDVREKQSAISNNSSLTNSQLRMMFPNSSTPCLNALNSNDRDRLKDDLWQAMGLYLTYSAPEMGKLPNDWFHNGEFRDTFPDMDETTRRKLEWDSFNQG